MHSVSSNRREFRESGRGRRSGSGYMQSKLLVWAERGALLVVSNSEGGGDILRILQDWQKASVDEPQENIEKT